MRPPWRRARERRERPAPGSREERRQERDDRACALLVAIAVHGAVLAAGNLGTDAEPLSEHPGAGPAGAQAVVALDADAAERLFARLGAPAPLLERDGLVAPPALPPPWSRAPDPLALETAVTASAPTTPPSAWRPPADALDAARAMPEPTPPREEPPRVAQASEPIVRERVPLPPPPTLDATPRSATPTGATGEARAGPAAQGGDDAPLLDANVLDGIVLYRENPEYPAHLRLRASRRAEALMEVGPDGAVTHVSIRGSTGHDELDDASLRALRRWQFDARLMAERGMSPRFRMAIWFHPR